MAEKIPYMTDQQVKKDYAQGLAEILGESSGLHISCATITSGLIVNRKTAHQHCATYPDGIDRVYILGIPASEKQPEQRGIGIMCSSESDFYKKLNEMGFSESHIERSGALLKPVDTTEELVGQLRNIETLIFPNS